MADTHVHEDDLTLLYYDELAEADARAARAHLERCGECRTRQSELARLLAMVGDTETPEPDAGFEAAMWRRLQPALRAARVPVRTPGGAGLAERLRAWLSSARRRVDGSWPGALRRSCWWPSSRDGSGRRRRSGRPHPEHPRRRPPTPSASACCSARSAITSIGPKRSSSS